jgi:large subunit ribosomal protein L4
LAILSALYLKKQQFTLIEEKFLDEFREIKTKAMIDFLKKLDIQSTAKTLIILTKPNSSIWLASRNLKNIEVTLATCLNIKQLLKANNIILSNIGLELINTTYGKSYT